MCLINLTATQYICEPRFLVAAGYFIFTINFGLNIVYGISSFPDLSSLSLNLLSEGKPLLRLKMDRVKLVIIIRLHLLLKKCINLSCKESRRGANQEQTPTQS